MPEAQSVGVQCLSGDQACIGMVEIITDQRKTKIFHMHTNLMGASCLQMKGEQGVPILCLQRLIMRDSMFAGCEINGALDDRAFLAGNR